MARFPQPLTMRASLVSSGREVIDSSGQESPTEARRRRPVARVVVSSTALGGPAESILWPEASTMLVSVGPLDLDPLGSRAQYRTVKIVAVAIPSGQVRLILANDSTHHFHREDFVYRGKRLYFTLAAWESDVGVMELTKRR